MQEIVFSPSLMQMKLYLSSEFRVESSRTSTSVFVHVYRQSGSVTSLLASMEINPDDRITTLLFSELPVSLDPIELEPKEIDHVTALRAAL